MSKITINIIKEENMEFIEQAKDLVSLNTDFKKTILENYAVLSLFISYLAYKTKYYSEKFCKNVFGADEYHFIEDKKTGTQAIIFKVDKIIYVSFRGTTISETRDLKTIINFDEDVLNPPNDLVPIISHRGFVNAIKRVAPVITKILNKHRDCALIYTGHSLGGALAMLLAAYKDPHEVIVFGSPKIFLQKNTVYKHVYQLDRFINIVNRFDIVTHLPFKLPCLPYHHQGESIKFTTTWRPFKAHSLNEYAKGVLEYGYVTPPSRINTP